MANQSLAGEIWQTLSAIDVSEHVEKKQNLSYLSWAWAWGVLMEHYPETQYEFTDRTFPNNTMEVSVVVTITKGDQAVSRSMWLPVMDYKNKAIPNPDAFAINTAKMRCLTKCFAMLGLGHYIYAGEDIPQASQEALQGVISREQADTIYSLLQSTGSDVVKFCEAFKCDTVDGLKLMHFDNAVALLKKKEQQNARA